VTHPRHDASLDRSATARFALSLAVAAVLLLPVQAAAQETAAPCANPRVQKVLESLPELMAEADLPSIAVAVGERGRISCEAAFGWASRAERVAATPETMYSLASISKPFTATAVMHFVEKRALGLDKPANDYLGAAKLRAFEGRVERATIERLLTHTAGLPLHYQFFYAGGPPVPTMDEAISRYGIVVYPPGERFFYSNFGYGVLERILERVGGRPYAEVLRDVVLQPLGLQSTIVSDGAGLDAGRAAVRYGTDGDPIRPYTFDHVAASGVWSSARDLVRFGLFHLGQDADGTGPVVSRRTRRRMQERHATADSPGQTRGLGWGNSRGVYGYRRVAHTGSMPGVSTVLSLYPDAGVAVVVLTNTNNGRVVAQIERQLAAAVLPLRPGTSAAEQLRSTGGAATVVSSAPAGSPNLSSIRGHWAGIARVAGRDVPLALTVGDEADVRVRIGAGPEARVVGARIHNRWFTGGTSAPLAPPDAAPPEHAAHRTLFTLTRRGQRLTGWATAVSTADPTFGAVSFSVELQRSAARVP
jgi:CubicO group peptidase (beta-lactamase class C family)